MRVTCPYCGARDISEFSYLGDASARRPDIDAQNVSSAFFEAVYLRDNPRGPHKELMYHSGGCRRWLNVERDTSTHEIISTSFASGEAL